MIFMLSINAYYNKRILFSMVSDKQRQYMKEYRAKGGETYRAYQALAQRKHRANNHEKSRTKGRESSRTYRQRQAEELERLRAIEKMILEMPLKQPSNK
jgi:hypothetical protein